MSQLRILPGLATLMVLGMAVAQAQTPFCNDGTAFGGSQIFSEGLNPLGNPARFDQRPSLLVVSYVTGDQRSMDNASALQDLPKLNNSSASAVLNQLHDSPWGMRSRAYSVSGLVDTVNAGYTREEINGTLATVDTLPSHLSDLSLNNTRSTMRYAVVDRTSMGIGSTTQGWGSGFTLRLERWRMGTQDTNLQAMVYGGDPMDFRGSSDSTLTFAMDFGLTYEIANGVRIGGTINRLNAKRLWDVDEKPQCRLGLQLDIGSITRLAIESDVNEAMRMPFPVNQRTSAASLRIAANPTLTLMLGAERKQIGDTSVTRGGATLQFHLSGWQIGAGMQYSKDHPLWGVATLVN